MFIQARQILNIAFILVLLYIIVISYHIGRTSKGAHYIVRQSCLIQNGSTTVNSTSMDVKLPNCESMYPVNKDLCPDNPPGLTGNWTPHMEIVAWEDQEKQHPELNEGGAWKPNYCIPRNHVAILIPYRSRREHLHIFINNIHGFLQKQQHYYQIYVIEQYGNDLFNRALLFNIGYTEALKDNNWGCFVLHDVDHIPMNDRNIYSCPKWPRHLAVAVERRKFKLPYRTYFGGVSILTKDQYEKVNGMANSYWGWGAEDDDLYRRLMKKGLLPIMRHSPKISRYASLVRFHLRAPRGKKRSYFLKRATSRMDTDGLNSLKYGIIAKEYRRLFTYILADVKPMRVPN